MNTVRLPRAPATLCTYLCTIAIIVWILSREAQIFRFIGNAASNREKAPKLHRYRFVHTAMHAHRFRLWTIINRLNASLHSATYYRGMAERFVALAANIRAQFPHAESDHGRLM